MSKPGDTSSRHQPNVSWFELFYDLIFIAIVAQVGKVLLATPTWEMAGLVLAAILSLFSVWLLVTVSHSLVPMNDPVRRAILLVQMMVLAVAVLALGVNGLPNWLGFIASSGALLLVSLVYWRNARQQPDLAPILRATRTSSAVGAVILAGGGVLVAQPGQSMELISTTLLLLGSLMSLLPILGRGLRELVRLDAFDLVHLEERFALFVIIILGESFVGLLLSVGRLGYIPNPWYFVLTFLVAYAIWANYYNILVPARMPATVLGLRIWILGHALLAVSVVAMAVEFTDLTLSKEAGKGLEFDGNWTPLPLFGVALALAMLAFVAQSVPPTLARVQLLPVAILAVLATIDLASGANHGDSYTLMGAVVLIADSVMCALLSFRGERRAVRQ